MENNYLETNNKSKNTKGLVISILLILSIIMSFYIIYNTSTQEKMLETSKIASHLSGKQIGLIQIEGTIAYETSKEIVETINSFKEDTSILGLILEINSGGGGVAATQKIFNAIKDFKTSKKPVVTCMGELTASGGYYISCATDYLIALPGTVTGSIGVIVSSYNLKELFGKLGVSENVIKSGNFKDILSPTRDMTEEEKVFLEKVVKNTYEQFTKVVLSSRKGKKVNINIYNSYFTPVIESNKKEILLNENILSKIADGRIYNGDVAYNLGLVDELGGIKQAVKYIKKECKISETEKIPLYEKEANPFDKLLKYFNNSATSTGINSKKIIDFIKNNKLDDKFNFSNLKDALLYYVYEGEGLNYE